MESPDSPRLLARVREKIRLKHYSIRTEQAYVEPVALGERLGNGGLDLRGEASESGETCGNKRSSSDR